MPRKPIPEELFDIPDDIPVEHRPHYGAQIAIQGVVHALGAKGMEPGKTAISTDDLLTSISMALAMLITADTRNSTPRDVRLAAEKWARIVAGYARILRESNDTVGSQLLAMLGLEQRDIPLN